MKRFDVFKTNFAPHHYVVNVQSEFIDNIDTKVVVPLVKLKDFKSESISRLKPRIVINGIDYILATTDMTAVSIYELGSHITNIETEYRYDITNAIDFLFNGF